MVEQAQAIVIGGGVGGTSIAYHLTELGWRAVVLVERAGLTSSSTTLTRMMMYGAGLIGRDALLAARDAGPPPRRLRCLVLDDSRSVTREPLYDPSDDRLRG